MMAYKIIRSEHNVKKFFHAVLHLTALCFGVAGICAVFKYHDMVNAEDMHTLHSWIGLTTFVLFCLQVLNTKGSEFSFNIGFISYSPCKIV